jgi:hypothetical protein
MEIQPATDLDEVDKLSEAMRAADAPAAVPARPIMKTVSPEPISEAEATAIAEHIKAEALAIDLNRRNSRALILNAWIRAMQTHRGAAFTVGALDVQALELAELALEGVPATDPQA